MPQWGAIRMLVAFSHYPPVDSHKRRKLLFLFYVSVFYTYTRSQKQASWLFYGILGKRLLVSKGLRAELPVKEKFLYELLLCVYGMCVKSHEALTMSLSMLLPVNALLEYRALLSNITM